MATIVQMPRLSDTMREGTIAQWLKAEGDMIEPGDDMADIETDKATMTFQSFDEGVLLKLLLAEGESAPLNAPIAILGDAGEDISEALEEAAALRSSVAASEADDTEAATPPATPTPEVADAPQVTNTTSDTPPSDAPAPAATTDTSGVRIKASPLARRIASERGIDLATVAGTGPQGRIIKRDLEGLDATRQISHTGGRGHQEDTVVRATQMRRTIAKRLLEAKNSAPHFYLTITLNCDQLVTLRQTLNTKQNKIKLSYNDLIMRACTVTLQDHPEINAAWEGDTIRQYGNVHLGFAVALEGGLITPVVREADRLTLVEMAQQTRSLAERARAGKLEPQDYSGNSFCISNLGMTGIEHFTAIINPPAACILAVGALEERPVVVNHTLSVGHRMTVTLSCDHRAVDGAMGAAFLADLKAVVEEPLHLLDIVL